MVIFYNALYRQPVKKPSVFINGLFKELDKNKIIIWLSWLNYLKKRDGVYIRHKSTPNATDQFVRLYKSG
jgi:hypothetical protein